MKKDQNSDFSRRKTRRIKHSSSSEALISRRNFLQSIGVAACSIGAGTLGLSGCTSSDNGAETPLTQDSQSSQNNTTGAYETSIPSASPISVATSSVFTIDDCEFIEDTKTVLGEPIKASLPYGTMLWASGNKVAACLIPGETSTPLAKIGLLSLEDGSFKTVLESSASDDASFEIYDVRANENGIAWLEANIISGDWKLYTCRIDGIELSGSPILAFEGSPDASMPQIAVSGDSVYWQSSLKPADGSAATSQIMRSPIASANDPEKLLTFSGARVCDIASTPNGIVCAIPASDKKSTYELVAINESAFEIENVMMLPQTMRPNYVAYGGSSFSFAFEDIYNTGEGISNLGTYTPVTSDTSGEWFRFGRTPYESPAWSRNWFLVKSTQTVAGVDLVNKRYFTIEPEVSSQAYGEYLASEGSSPCFVTYDNVDFTPLNSERVKKCAVRIWRPLVEESSKSEE